MFNKYSLSILVLLLPLGSLSANYTATGTTAPRDQEERFCLQVLNDQIESESGEGGRFPYKSLKNAVIKEQSDSVNLSNYDNFLHYRMSNGRSKYFKARRNNIGTILTNRNYLLSQVVPIGEIDTNFEFPRQAYVDKNMKRIKKEGDKYARFTAQTLYTHHLIDGTFLSCGYLEIVPTEKAGYNGLSRKFYKTNGVSNPTGMFEISNYPTARFETSNTSKEYRYLVGRVDVPAYNYDDEHQFTMRLVTVAYDNGSSKLNEYQTFPLQVESMTDMDRTAGDGQYSAHSLQMHFNKLIEENTCLQIPHGTVDSLPASCGGKFSFTKNTHSNSEESGLLANVAGWLIPSASAALPEEDIDQDWEVPASGMLAGDVLPYRLYKKLSQIPDKTFQAYIRTALLANLHVIFEHEKNAGIQWKNDFQAVFQKCNISYDERVDIVIDYLEKLDPKTWDIHNITYKNPRFGDCIVPYPDKRNIDTVIPDSFQSNQFQAQLRAIGTGGLELEKPSHSAETLRLIKERQKLETEYNRLVYGLNQDLEQGRMNKDDFEAKLKEAHDKLQTDLVNIPSNQEEKSIFAKFLTKSGLLVVGGVGIIFLGALVLFFVFRSKKTTKNRQ